MNAISWHDAAARGQLIEGNRPAELFTDEQREVSSVFSPHANQIGQKSLSIAARARGNNCQSDGVAPGATVGSYMFFNASGRNTSLQYVVCARRAEWGIALIPYRYLLKYSDGYRYTRLDVAPPEFARDSLSDRRLVVPAVHETTDVLHQPPARCLWC
jgi:hypothetical protein